jgi:crossover junction endodeoxyribonuclease RuvC
MRLIGLDPGLRTTGWGLVDVAGSRLSHVANGIATSDQKLSTAERLNQIYDQLTAVILEYRPDAAAVEETFVNKNPVTTLKLGLARGAVLLAPARAGLKVAEYSANAVKKAVVGVGHADKDQVGMMVRRLLPGVAIDSPDAADALAVAICHAHHSQTHAAWARGAGNAA